MTIDGLTARQIGERLFIGRRTVETHLESAYAKLQIDSKRELIAQAFDARREAAVTTLGAHSRPDDRLSKG
jgi:DNA-binding CsgD family transcriptional regulator